MKKAPEGHYAGLYASEINGSISSKTNNLEWESISSGNLKFWIHSNSLRELISENSNVEIKIMEPICL